MDLKLVAGLERLVSLGRSSKWSYKRRLVMERHRSAPLPKEPLERARALRLRGEDPVPLLKKIPGAAARALLWEATGRRSYIEEACALERRWGPWRGLALLLEPPASHYKRAPRGINRVAATPGARAAARAALETGDAVVRALAYEDLGEARAAIRELRGATEAWQLVWRADAKRRAGDLAGFAADLERALLLEENAAAFRFALSPTAPNAKLAAMPARRWWELAARAEARRSPEGGDHEGGVQDLRALVKAKPRSAWAWAYLGRAVGGEAELRRAVALSPGTGWLHAWLGEQLRRQGALDEAFAELERAISLDPDYELSYAWRGGIFLARGRAEEALADLELACALDPRYAWAQSARARALEALGRPAAEAWKLAGKLAPWRVLLERKDWAGLERFAAGTQRHDEVEAMATAWLEKGGGRRALALRAEARRCLGRHDEAAEDFASMGAARSRGVALRAARRYEEALVCARRARDRDLESECLRALGRGEEALRAARKPVTRAKALRALGRLEDAAKALRAPRDAKELGWAGVVALERGDKKKAAALLERACAKDPQCAWTLALLGQARGRWELVERAVRLDPRCSCAYDFLVRGRGPDWVHAWLGAAARAAGDLEEARRQLELAGPAAWWLAWRGELELARGKPDEALRALAAPPHADAWVWRGRALCELGRCDEALRAFRRAPKDHVWALVGAGVCLERRGRSAEAARLLGRAKQLAPGLWR